MSSSADLLVEPRTVRVSLSKAVEQYCASGHSSVVSVDGFAPPVKVARVLRQLLAEAGEHAEIERIRVRGRSGCSDFTGTVEVFTASGSTTIEFVWCCRWRAEQEGWTDYFGFPDQMRAAREFDWRCFQVWNPITS